MSNGRLKQLRRQVADDACILISHPVNIRYLCGFSGSNGLLLCTPKESYLITDSRYDIQSRQECFDVEVVIAESGLMGSALSLVSGSELSFEAIHMSVATYDDIASARPDLRITPTHGLVEKLRITKDSEEIQTIRNACTISMQALELLVDYLRPGLTEREVARHLEHTMIQLGADDRAFESIVATGANSAIPHHQPTTREIETGDLIKIDFGAKVDGYHSDCTRMFIAGVPTQWQRELHELVRKCQAMAREALHGGVPASQVDRAAREFMQTHNVGHLFTHGLGHGVGLEIHEDPYFSRESATTIEPRTVVTIEPGAYITNQGGVRIEDTVVVTEVGYENLTNFSYDLITIS